MNTTRLNSKTVKSQMFEKELWAKGELICGIDEVGRSSIAGPLVAAAAILRPGAKYKYLKDSKLLTPEEREKAFVWLQKNCVYSVGIVHHRIIDKINIYHADLVAMKRALINLLAKTFNKPAIILVDHMPLKVQNLDIPIKHFCYGEKKSASIAAASIIAKVTRDRLMARLDLVIPGYYFASNKGYGSKAHRNIFREIGISFIHRKSFLYSTYWGIDHAILPPRQEKPRPKIDQPIITQPSLA